MRVELHELAKYIFLQNTDGNVVLEVDGITTVSDMFCFCIELLYKGLHLLFGHSHYNENDELKEYVNIDALSIDDFQIVKQKMLCAGIDVTLNVIPIVVSSTAEEAPKRSVITEIEVPMHGLVHHGYKSAHDAPLHHHHLVMTTEKAKYDISFKLVHNVNSAMCSSINTMI